MTHGKYFRPRTPGPARGLPGIDRLEREKIESFQYRYFSEGFAWFGLAVLVLLATVHCWKDSVGEALCRNPNPQTRNPKQITIPNRKIPNNQESVSDLFRIWDLGFVSDFGFRYSDFSGWRSS